MTSPDGPAAPVKVTIYVDPICPFAWLTSRWLLEVAAVRDLDITFGLMSLSVLNEHRDNLSDFYVDLLGRAWGPARVALAIERQDGSAAFRRYYEAFGERYHVADRGIDDGIVAESLAAAGLPAGLVDLAADPSEDDALRRAHHVAEDLVGDEVGTPVLHIEPPGADSFAIFGPVVTAAPSGELAGRIWDGVVALAGVADFCELKRSRRRELRLR